MGKEIRIKETKLPYGNAPIIPSSKITIFIMTIAFVELVRTLGMGIGGGAALPARGFTPHPMS
jgi:hypothetical protein